MPDWTLDSVALIDWYCGRGGVLPYLEKILDKQTSGAFSTISELELWQGIRPGEEARHEAMLALLERVSLISIKPLLDEQANSVSRSVSTSFRYPTRQSPLLLSFPTVPCSPGMKLTRFRGHFMLLRAKESNDATIPSPLPT
jgi:hypothetical protein